MIFCPVNCVGCNGQQGCYGYKRKLIDLNLIPNRGTETFHDIANFFTQFWAKTAYSIPLLLSLEFLWFLILMWDVHVLLVKDNTFALK
jgi:hypothetical protein